MWFPERPLFGGKNTLQKRFGTKDSVRCSEFRGGRFSEVANVLQVWDFQSVTRTLSALGSVSASRSVRSGRFYCKCHSLDTLKVWSESKNSGSCHQTHFLMRGCGLGMRLQQLLSKLLPIYHVLPSQRREDITSLLSNQ